MREQEMPVPSGWGAAGVGPCPNKKPCLSKASAPGGYVTVPRTRKKTESTKSQTTAEGWVISWLRGEEERGGSLAGRAQAAGCLLGGGRDVHGRRLGAPLSHSSLAGGQEDGADVALWPVPALKAGTASPPLAPHPRRWHHGRSDLAPGASVASAGEGRGQPLQLSPWPARLGSAWWLWVRSGMAGELCPMVWALGQPCPGEVRVQAAGCGCWELWCLSGCCPVVAWDLCCP